MRHLTNLKEKNADMEVVFTTLLESEKILLNAISHKRTYTKYTIIGI
jgi:hypothetical protein